MKLELDLPASVVKDLRKKSSTRGLSVSAYATEVLSGRIERRLAEGLDNIREGRSYGPFETHAELMACLRGTPKKVTRTKRRE
jgi:hypothetical protein